MNPIESMLKTQATMEGAAPQLSKLKEACTQMESVFMKDLVSQMRKGAGNVHFGKDFGGEVFGGMMDETLSDIMAHKAPMGVAAAMYTPMANQVVNGQKWKMAHASAQEEKDTEHTEEH